MNVTTVAYFVKLNMQRYVSMTTDKQMSEIYNELLKGNSIESRYFALRCLNRLINKAKNIKELQTASRISFHLLDATDK